ncbi:MAG: CBS domain-containing protein [Gammaproteobacteria bacterium]|nr:CBS domain-containing protein [Gammaproteobacteria bacterium]
MRCTIDSLVTEAVATLDESKTVEQAVALMAERNVGSLVVTSSTGVAGLFTERDLIRRVIGQGKDPAALKLSEVCTRNLVSISIDSSCQEAIKKMHSNLCRRLVVYRGDKFMGLVNLREVANSLAEKSHRDNTLVNIIGGVTFAAAIGVIILLLYNLPNMMQLAGKVTGKHQATELSNR